MKNNVKKIDILNEIQNKINVCLEYQKSEHDFLAEKRIKSMEKNQCSEKKYFINVTFNDVIPIDDVNLESRLKYLEYDSYLLSLNEIDEAFEIGCIIEVINKNDFISFNVEKINSFSNLTNILINHYYNENYILKILEPKKTIIDDNFIKDDIDLLKSSNKTKLIYSIGRFNKKIITDIIKSKIDTEKFDLHKININKMNEVKYIDITKSTPFEQNVNQFFKNPKILNEITLFSSKKCIPNYDFENSYVIYDIAEFINNSLNEIKNCDQAMSRKKYELYSKNIFKSNNDTKYNMYKSFGGDETWPNWKAVQEQFLYFKSVSSYDDEFKKLALNNENFSKNLYAYEKTADLISNIDFKCVNESWNKETKIFKKRPVLNVEFNNSLNSESEKKALEIISKSFIDPPCIIVKPYNNTNISFNENINYKFSFNIEDKNGESSFISCPDKKFKKVECSFKSNNKIYINRDFIKINGNEYFYTNDDIKCSDNESVLNELNKSQCFKIPKYSYYDKNNKSFFDSFKLNERLRYAEISYSVIPKSVESSVKFINYSSWNSLELAKKDLEKAKKEYENQYSRLVIDTINYDPWENIIESLEKLYGFWNSLESDENNCFDLSFKNISEDKNRINLCSKYFPINIYGNIKNENPLFYKNTYMYDFENNNVTYGKFAKLIYENIFKDKFTGSLENLKKLLSVSYSDIETLDQFKIENSFLNQVTYSDFEFFKNVYSKNSFKLISKRKLEKLFPVGLMNGHIYMPTGYEIKFIYNTINKKLNISGTSLELTEHAFKLDTDDFNEYIKSLSDLFFNINENSDYFSDSLKKFIVYPHVPSIEKILKGEEKPSKNEYEYKIDQYDLKKLKTQKNGIIEIRFSIYEKKPIRCSYPKCETKTNINENNNGICGLNEYVKNTNIINKTQFILEKELKNRFYLKKYEYLREISSKLTKNISNVIKSSLNKKKNLELIKSMKYESINKLNKFNEENLELLSFVPNKTSSDNSNSLICSVSKKSKYNSIINDYEKIASYIINSIVILIENDISFFENSFEMIIKNMLSETNKMNKYEDDKSNIKCNLKHQKYLDDNMNVKLLNDGINEKENNSLALDLEKEVRMRMKERNILENTKNLNISKNKAKKLTQMISNNNINGIKSFFSRNDNLSENNKFSLSFLNNFSVSKNGNDSIIKNIINTIKNSFNINSSLEDKNSINDIVENIPSISKIRNITPEHKNIQNDYEQLLDNEYQKNSENILNSINGSKSDEIKNQSSSQVNNMLLDEENSKVNISNDIIISMYQFIDESCDDYEKLTNEHISLD